MIAVPNKMIQDATCSDRDIAVWCITSLITYSSRKDYELLSAVQIAYHMKRSLDISHGLTDNIILEGCRARTEAILHPAEKKKTKGTLLDEPI